MVAAPGELPGLIDAPLTTTSPFTVPSGLKTPPVKVSGAGEPMAALVRVVVPALPATRAPVPFRPRRGVVPLRVSVPPRTRMPLLEGVSRGTDALTVVAPPVTASDPGKMPLLLVTVAMVTGLPLKLAVPL